MYTTTSKVCVKQGETVLLGVFPHGPRQLSSTVADLERGAGAKQYAWVSFHSMEDHVATYKRRMNQVAGQQGQSSQSQGGHWGHGSMYTGVWESLDALACQWQLILQTMPTATYTSPHDCWFLAPLPSHCRPRHTPLRWLPAPCAAASEPLVAPAQPWTCPCALPGGTVHEAQGSHAPPSHQQPGAVPCCKSSLRDERAQCHLAQSFGVSSVCGMT